MANNRTTTSTELQLADVRPLNGDQRHGFEELCVQFLPWLVGSSIARVVRIEGRGGDGGVEAIAYTTPCQVVGLQSKFFSSLGRSQWTQIDQSVRTAIEQHPELTRYLVCVPQERTPTQIKKWDSLVASWQKLSPALSVEWVGSSELLGHLLKPDAQHLRTYWFSCLEFSGDWVTTQTKVAIRQLHDRYTPRLHQPTAAEERLEFLTASPKARAVHREQCSELVIAWRLVQRDLPYEIEKLDTSVDLSELQTAIDTMLVAMGKGDLIEQCDVLVAALGALGEKAEQLVEALFSGESRYSGPYWEFRRNTKLEDALTQTARVIRAVSTYIHAQRQALWVLTGEAGTGKSHLLAELANKLLTEGRACLLIVGERFTSNAALAEQIPALVNWNWSLGDLLACLSAQAAITGQTAILMVDAINESPRGLWRRELLQLTALISEYVGVRLLVSCRTDCLDSSLPPDIQNEHNTFQHHGFDLQFHEAVQAYFDGYQVISTQFPTLNPEFQNPLFLKTLCEAYQGKTLPLGPMTFTGVLAAWEARVAEDIEKKLDCSRRATLRAIDDIVLALANNAKRISADEAEAICQKHFTEQRVSLSLYRHLNSAGLLQEVETSDGTVVRLQYERFSDVRVAQRALKDITTKSQWLAHWLYVFLPSKVDRGGLDWAVAPELTAYALLLPDAIGVELVESPIGTVIRKKWPRKQAKRVLWDAWLNALPWRAPSYDDRKIPRLFAMWAKQAENLQQVWERLFQFVCIPGHPLNADRLHRCLSKLDLPVREQKWTVPLAKEDPGDPTEGVVGPFLYWADAAAGKASEDQVRLAALVLLWLTSSPNRELRDRATDVTIRLLATCQQAGAVSMHLLEAFWEVNDPYVKERLLAVMCGVLPHLNAQNAKLIAEFVLSRFWLAANVPPHILQREYAAFVVRHACETGLLSREYLTLLEHWPQKAKPAVWTEEQVDVYDKDPGYAAIADSLRPEEMRPGWYGDFGRYTMGAAVHHFEDDERAEATTSGLGRGGKEHDARFARRYIWQRVIELGWTPERFSEFERGLGYSSRMGDKTRIERISKKYQWIGLHEYLGHLSDALLFREWGATPRPLQGAWELHERDYHPEMALGTKQVRDAGPEDPPVWWKVHSPVPSYESVEEKRAWVQSAFQSFEPYLKIDHEQRRWVVLYTHLNFNENLSFGTERFSSAQMSQWIDARAFLIPNALLSKRLKTLKALSLMGDGCDIPGVSQCWLTEYPWHPSFRQADQSCLNNYTWFRGLNGDGFYLPVCEISDDHRNVLLPAPSFHRDLGTVLGHPLSAPTLAADGFANIFDDTGRCIVKGSVQQGTVLMIDEATLMTYLKVQNLTLVWGVLSEKSAWDGSDHIGGLADQSAVYVLGKNGQISGGHTISNKILPEP